MSVHSSVASLEPPLACDQCRYNLAGLTDADECSECGRPVALSRAWRHWLRTDSHALLTVEIASALMAMGCALAYGAFAVQIGVPGGLPNHQLQSAMMFATCGVAVDILGASLLVWAFGRAARRCEVCSSALALGAVLGAELLLVCCLWIAGLHSDGVIAPFIVAMLIARLAHHFLVAEIAVSCLRALEPVGAAWVASFSRVGVPALALVIALSLPARGWSGRPPLIHLGDMLIAMIPVAAAVAPFSTLSVASRRTLAEIRGARAPA